MSRHHLPGSTEILDHWTLTVAPAWSASLGDPAIVRRLVLHPERVIQANDRGTVSLVRVGADDLVVKRSLVQERRRWIQLHSVYRGGEGLRAYRNLCRLRDAGLRVPEPVFALERTRVGLVLESWHAYRYLDGEPCTCADAPLIAATLKRLHDRGWVHRDPHVKNFLKHGSEAGIIDCAKARPWRFGYAQRYDVVLLNKCCPGARSAYPEFSEADTVYKLAQWHNRGIILWRRTKRRLRGVRP